MKSNFVALKEYSNSWYHPGSLFKRILWMITSFIFFQTRVPFPSIFKVFLLRLFGSNIGVGVVIKPNVTIKYPWFLEVGDYSWIGEECWIDNIVSVVIGNNSCISQGAYILTGNHDYTKAAFDLMPGKIIIEDGCWVGAKATVCPGVRMGVCSILTVSSTATNDCSDFGIYQGNPAILKKERTVNN